MFSFFCGFNEKMKEVLSVLFNPGAYGDTGFQWFCTPTKTTTCSTHQKTKLCNKRNTTVNRF